MVIYQAPITQGQHKGSPVMATQAVSYVAMEEPLT